MTQTNYNDGLWHGWNGGECPVHSETLVEVTNGVGIHKQPAWRTNWGATIAFRVVKEHLEPREFWVDPDRCIAVSAYHAGFIHVREVLE